MNSDTYFMGSLIAAIAVLIPIVIYIEKKALQSAGKKEGREIYPQPLQVSAAPRYVTKDDCEKQHAMQERALESNLDAATERFRSVLLDELRKMETVHTDRTNALRKELSDQIDGVHRRVDLIFKVMSKSGDQN